MHSFVGFTDFRFDILKQNDLESISSCYWACFPLSIHFALNCGGYTISFDEVLDEAKRHRSFALLASRGMSSSDAISILKSIRSKPKLRVFPNQTKETIKEIRMHLAFKIPIIAIQAHHALVITGIDSNLIYFYDPDDCKSLISSSTFEDFLDSWGCDEKFFAITVSAT